MTARLKSSTRRSSLNWSPSLSLDVSLAQMLDSIRIDGLNSAYAVALTWYWSRFGAPMIGSTRAVFAIGHGKVVKVPYDYQGEEANIAEAAHADPAIPFTPTNLLSRDGVPTEILAADDGRPFALAIAEEVTPVLVNDDEDHRLAWVQQLADGPQIGRLLDGTLVAYDL
jgi:hypothetical protein